MDFNIDYLDLVLPKIEKKIIKIEQFTHKCYFANSFKHNMHGDNMQLHSIIHMIISLGMYLEEQGKRSLPKHEISRDLHYNLEYIKIQNNDILGTLRATKNNSSSHSRKELDNKYNKIKQFLEEIKHLIAT